MRKTVLWLLALSIALAAFIGAQANRVQANKKESLVVLHYNNLSVPCSRPIVTGQVYHPVDPSLHSPVDNRHGAHIMLAAYYVPPLMAPASLKWGFFHSAATFLGLEQMTYDEKTVVSPWPALSHKDWVVTGVPLTPVVIPKPLKVSQVCQ